MWIVKERTRTTMLSQHSLSTDPSTRGILMGTSQLYEEPNETS
jgi:hypothetical protein